MLSDWRWPRYLNKQEYPSRLWFGHYDQDALHLKCDGSVHPYLNLGETDYNQDALHLKYDRSVHPYLYLGKTNYDQAALHHPS